MRPSGVAKAMIKFARLNGCNMISLEVPGRIEFRRVVLRTVSAACRLVIPNTRTRGTCYAEYTDPIASAVGEAYNNIVLHGYAGREPDPIRLQIEICAEWMRIVINDTGISFDPALVTSPDLEALPESGLGIFIMRSMVDEVTYVAGRPNTLTLVKRFHEGERVLSMTPAVHLAAIWAGGRREIRAEGDAGARPKDRLQRSEQFQKQDEHGRIMRNGDGKRHPSELTASPTKESGIG